MKKTILAVLTFIPTVVFANPGAYIQAQAGVNFVDPTTGRNVTATTASGFVGGVGIGYLLGNNTLNYGAELNSLWYPSTTGDVNYFGGRVADNKYNGYNISLLGVLKYTFCSNGFVVLGKAGVAFTHQEQTVTSVGFPDISGSSSKISPELALGVGYQFNPNVEVDLTADAVIVPSSSNNNLTGTTPDNNGNLLLGLIYHFA